MQEFIEDLEKLLKSEAYISVFVQKYEESTESPIKELMYDLDHYLSDSDCRAKEPEYAEMQRSELKKMIALLKKGEIKEALDISFLSATSIKTYHCSINGKNFLLELDGKKSKHGFYKWVTVEAKDESEAELLAVEKVKNDEQIKASTQNPQKDSPQLFLDEIYEAEETAEKPNEMGYAFYPEKKWWAFWK